MSLFSFLKKKKQFSRSPKRDRGILVFESTTEVIQAEKILKSRGCDIRVMGPPPDIQSGCDLVIEFSITEKLRLLRLLHEAGVTPREIVSVDNPLLEPVNLFHTKDFGKYLMVRAANMKITVEKQTLTIVNVSGGGCPDVPYLAREMVGKSLAETPRPEDIGHTLCGYALQLALEEMERRCSQ